MDQAFKQLSIRDRTRFVERRVRSDEVERTRLDAHYQDARGEIVRLLAPAGYGKSSIIARWVSDEDRPVLWLDLERIDNDPRILVDALLSGFTERVDSTFETLNGRAGGEELAGEELVPTFAQLVRACPTPFVVVLDDIHNVDEPMGAEVLDVLAENLPPTSTLVLAGRAHHHDTAISRLRLRPGVTDLNADDLAFNLAETNALLDNLVADLDDDTIATIAERFEGWPAGVRLAALTLRAGVTTPLQASELGSSRYVTEYLANEWLGRLDADDRTLITEAACLGRFSGVMCDEVLERTGAADDLQRLRHDFLALLAVDERDREFRFHSLLRDFLCRELREGSPSRFRQIHGRASTYWEAEGDIDLAVEHAVAADDLERCARLIAAHGGTYQVLGMAPTVSRWLVNLPDPQVRASAPLCVLSSTNAMNIGDGELALRWTRALSSVRPDDDDVITPHRADLLFAALEFREPAEIIPVARRAYANLDPGTPWRAFACWVLAGNLFLVGEIDESVETMHEGAFEAELLGAELMRSNCLAHLAILLDLRGEHEAARTTGGRAYAGIRNYRAEHLPTTAGVAAVHSLIEARAGRCDSSAESLATSRGYLAGFATVSPWYNAIPRLALIRASLLCDRAAVGQELLRELDSYILGGAATEFDELVDPLRVSVEGARKLLADRTWSLTKAELRVMQYLPTNLSLADIATQLFVSRNTVKSHAAAIYRKLGTTSRSEAVDIARHAGLLGDQATDIVVG